MKVTIRVAQQNRAPRTFPNEEILDDCPAALQFDRAPGCRAITLDFGATVITFTREEAVQ